jgi:hypothetical protein
MAIRQSTKQKTIVELQAESQAWQTRVFAAERRIGRKRLDLLSWLVRFVQHNPDELRTSSPADLATSDAEAFAFVWNAQQQPDAPGSIAGWQERHDMFADGGVLAALVEQPRPVIEGIITAVGSGDGGAIAGVPIDHYGKIHFVVTKIGARDFEPKYTCSDTRDAFLLLATHLISTEWSRLRACDNPECGKWFVRQKRGRYCSAACGHRVQVKKWRDEMGEAEWKKLRHGYYEASFANRDAANRHRRRRARGAGAKPAAPMR